MSAHEDHASSTRRYWLRAGVLLPPLVAVPLALAGLDLALFGSTPGWLAAIGSAGTVVVAARLIALAPEVGRMPRARRAAFAAAGFLVWIVATGLLLGAVVLALVAYCDATSCVN